MYRGSVTRPTFSRRTSQPSAGDQSRAPQEAPPPGSVRTTEVARLYEYPCTDNGPQGPDMILTKDQVDGIVALLGEVRDRALPDVTVA